MKRTYGNVATGDRFGDRKEDLALLIQRIDDGQHVLLVAQRRMGKTSLMKEAMARLKNRYTCLFNDLGVKLRAGLTHANWAEKGDQLLDILATSD